MKYLVLEDKGKKKQIVSEACAKKNLNVIFCSTSSEFMTAVTASKYDTAVINVKAWGRGRAIYDYFGVGKKMDGKPVIFYNAREHLIPVIKYRNQNENDVVHNEPTDIETVMETL